jgi:hypothetical protein
MKQNRLPDVMGLRLSRQALRVLKERGIFAHSPVSLEHQHMAKRYVVRGLESGGAAGELGRYVTFTQEDGQPIEWLHPVEAIGVNGLHAVVVAPVLVRGEMLRKGQTYELLISRHSPGKTSDGKRPPLETKVLFRGVHGRLELDLSGKDKNQAGGVLPTFYSLAGEEISIPKQIHEATLGRFSLLIRLDRPGEGLLASVDGSPFWHIQSSSDGGRSSTVGRLRAVVRITY